MYSSFMKEDRVAIMTWSRWSRLGVSKARRNSKAVQPSSEGDSSGSHIARMMISEEAGGCMYARQSQEQVRVRCFGSIQWLCRVSASGRWCNRVLTRMPAPCGSWIDAQATGTPNPSDHSSDTCNRAGTTGKPSALRRSNPGPGDLQTDLSRRSVTMGGIFTARDRDTAAKTLSGSNESAEHDSEHAQAKMESGPTVSTARHLPPLQLARRSRVVPEPNVMSPEHADSDFSAAQAVASGKEIGGADDVDRAESMSLESGASPDRAGLDDDDNAVLSGLDAKKKSSVASSQSRSSSAVFHKAVEQDAKLTEPSLKFLRRALYVVWLTVVAAAIVILIVDSGIVTGATDDEAVVHSEGDRAALHSVRVLAALMAIVVGPLLCGRAL